MNANPTSSVFSDIVLDRVESYDASQLNCYAFRRGTDVRDGLSLALGNMVSGFPYQLESIQFHNSECAYIAGAFSEEGNTKHAELQVQLRDCPNGYLAKKAIRRPQESHKRADWEEFNIQWMLYVVWQKVLGNSGFRELLLSLPEEAVIIEDSTFQAGRTATIWGTRNAHLRLTLNQMRKDLKGESITKAAMKRQMDGYRLGEGSRKGCFEGKNLMGKILMLCSRALRQGVEPPIDYALLRRSRICLLGKVLDFSQN